MSTAIVFLLILTSAVLVHELAHYWNAKSVGLPVRAFSVGMGPVIWRTMWRGTEWRLSLLPIGGYVDIPGMTPKQAEDGSLQHPDEGFATKPLAAKLWVLVGGVIANYLLAIILLATVITFAPDFRTITAGMTPELYGAQIAGVVEDSSAEALGLQVGDIITRVNTIDNPNPDAVTQQIRITDGILTLEVMRGATPLVFETPWPPQVDGERPLLGIQIAALEAEPLPPVNFFEGLVEATTFSVRIIPEAIRGFVVGFASVVAGQQTEEVAGPVGIVRAVNEARQVGIMPVLALAALINFSLAIFNILPIPGLDGGRMLLASIVALRGKPFRPGQEEFIHFLGIMAVLAFMVLITFNELSGLFFRS
jgi:regulator of sigma E protease